MRPLWTNLAGLLGLALFLAVSSDAFEVMLLPRRIRRQLRPVRFFFQSTWCIWKVFARAFRRPGYRDALLSAYGPLSMVFLLALWAAGLIFSFGLLHWAINGNSQATSFATDLYLSGATFFTLGYGDVVPKTPGNKVLAVFESGAGLAFVAVTIGYLPVLYQLFSRREARVIQLDTRAGSPPSAATLLSRHSEFDALPELNLLLKEWEQWSAELVESHLSYPMLSYYRSQHDNQSWLAALTAILDTSTLILTGLRGIPTFQARITFSMARSAVVELCRVFHLRTAKKQNDRLPPQACAVLEETLASAGLFFSEPGASQERLAAFRSTYEPYVGRLSRHFLLPLPAWSAKADVVDNWQRSRGGLVAKELVENAPVNPE